MATFPTYAHIRVSGASQEHSEVVQRSEMERGTPKVRRINSDALVTQTATVVFRSQDDLNAFENWYYSASGGNGGAGWFDWTDPRAGVVRQARIAKLGALTPMAGKYSVAEWQCSLEYMRSAY